ncbi:MAG: cyclodeaminase/cyclohydrolase family protein, partial [Candidatus Bipolaricaulota bacterium]
MAKRSMVSYSLGELLAAVGSDDPTPGGGTAAAVAGALAAALLRMVAALALRRAKEPHARETAAALVARAEILAEKFQDLADRDAAAYARVANTLCLPKGTPDEESQRRLALQKALAG